jgi:hypothetical protein
MTGLTVNGSMIVRDVPISRVTQLDDNFLDLFHAISSIAHELHN